MPLGTREHWPTVALTLFYSLRFTMCRWGARSGAAVEMFAARIDAALSQQHHEDDGVVSPDEAEIKPASASDAEAKEEAQSHALSEDRKAELRLACEIAAHELDRSESKPTHPLRLISAYGQSAEGEPAFTNLTSTFNDTLDYIFYHPASDASTPAASSSSSTAPPRLTVTAVRRVTDDAQLDLVELAKTDGAGGNIPKVKVRRDKNQLEEVEPPADAAQEAPAGAVAPLSLVLPNLSWPSDHLLLQATFALRP
jgi:hypothetical protein